VHVGARERAGRRRCRKLSVRECRMTAIGRVAGGGLVEVESVAGS